MNLRLIPKREKCEMDSKTATSGGFSIVEVLVVLALVATISGLILTSLSQLAVLREREELINGQEELDRVALHMVKVIEQAQSLPLSLADADRDALFSGRKDRLEFTALLQTGVRSVDLRRVSLMTTKSNQERLTLIQEMSVRRGIGKQIPKQIIVLDQDVVSVKFEYLQPAEGEIKPVEWLAVWDNSNSLPSSVRVVVSKKIGERILQAQAIALLQN